MHYMQLTKYSILPLFCLKAYFPSNIKDFNNVKTFFDILLYAENQFLR